jgi:hypothetical protein
MDRKLYWMTYEQIMAQPEFCFEVDMRWPPTPAHLHAFTRGWYDIAYRGQAYSGETLQRLTWCNLGWRMGKMEGKASSDEIRWAFEWFAAQWTKRRASPRFTPGLAPPGNAR